jgi:hypothetical protein
MIAPRPTRTQNEHFREFWSQRAPRRCQTTRAGWSRQRGGTTVRSDTQSITINARPGDVLAFVGDGANLPRWAIGFAKSVRPGPAGWIVTTGQGEVPISITVDEVTGTVDFRMEPTAGVETTAYARVVPNAGGSEFLFTQMQEPDMPDELFEQLIATVGHELVALKALVEVRCPL